MIEFDGIQKMLGYTRRACADYNMIEDGDRIAIGVSGGKDSLALLCFMAKLKRFYEKKYEIVAVTLDAGFPGADLSNITELCRGLEIEHHIIVRIGGKNARNNILVTNVHIVVGAIAFKKSVVSFT